MNLSLGIFDLFATAIPGSLYLLAGLYVSVQAGWVEPEDLGGVDTTFALAGSVVGSYLLGQVFAPILRQVLEMVPLWRQGPEAARRDFTGRNPEIGQRRFVEVDPFTLLAGLRQHSGEAASEVDRARAIGIMLRSSSPAFFVGAVIAAVQAVCHDHYLAGSAAALVLLGMSALSLREGRKFSHWALIHTYECAAWIPGVDEVGSGSRPSPPQPPPEGPSA
jgi:hypothetical protein